MAFGTWVAYVLVIDVLAAFVLGFVTSLNAFKKRRLRQRRKPSGRQLLVQAHATLYFLLSILATVAIVGYTVAAGVKDSFLLEQHWANQQWLPIRVLLFLVVGYLFFGVVFFISHQTSESFNPLAVLWAEQLEHTWKAYRSGRPVSEEEALLRYSFAPEWP